MMNKFKISFSSLFLAKIVESSSNFWASHKMDRGNDSSSSSEIQEDRISSRIVEDRISSGIEEDRISELPDSLIHHILSFMDIEYAVQTCILSRRWRYIWTSMPLLKFDDSIHYYKEEEPDQEFSDECYDYQESTEEKLERATKRYIKFVNQVLNLRGDYDIQRFHIEFVRFRPDVSEIHNWIDTAVNGNVQVLIFRSYVEGVLFKSENGFVIPPCLCTCQSLTKMELGLWGWEYGDSRIILPHKMSLPRLKSLRLSLHDMAFYNEKLTNRFFASFPSLESLIMETGSFGIHNMNLQISLPKLKYFKFNSQSWESGNSRYYKSNCEVKLHAPSLSSFIFNGHVSTSFTLENLSSLAIADIEMNVKSEDRVSIYSTEICEEKKEMYAQGTMGLLRGIHSVKVLKLHDSVLKALGGAPDILDTQLPEYYNLQQLELDAYLTAECLHSIFSILKSSPRIESISLWSQGNFLNPLLYPYCDEVKFNPENIGDYWDAGLSMSCMICQVKFVEIKGLSGYVTELKFLEILLKHATGLEKVVISSCELNKARKGRNG
ncbi:F-box/LRR-repeat protein At4g14103-like isoform X2 [Papaver somniferum]|uniref:F-box/LRR-repeat protein At4g14103-like isoform X2 n=1 Tax=Papaver somniferum TaxID=3469 RepID=UPI000E6F53C3|nr:F-box/LRR-repeat protein At4g14103-like isoform X2 [Papaver somniferum]